MLKHFFRDFTRAIRARAFCALRGNQFDFRDIKIQLPADYAFYARKLLKSGNYEKQEADFIEKYLPADRSVIELGGSLGVVGAYIRSRLLPEVEHVVVEANPNIMAICEANIKKYDVSGHSTFLQGAISYGSDTLKFKVSKNVHANRVLGANEKKAGPFLEVKSLSLKDCLAALSNKEKPSLVADIEGAEFDLFANEADLIKSFGLVILEIHPSVFLKSGKTEADFMALVSASGMTVVERCEDVLVLKPLESAI